MVGYMMRYAETYLKAKSILTSGVLGKVITFGATIYVSQLFRTGKGWRYDKSQSGGGVVIGQATHLIDLLQWFFGPVQSVSARTRGWYSKDVEDFAHAILNFADGLYGCSIRPGASDTIACSKYASRPRLKTARSR